MLSSTLKSVCLPLGLAAVLGATLPAAHAQDVSGSVKLDGSSTVFPLSEAVAEEFQAKHKGVRVTVGISGTSGGFTKFLGGEIDINDASRPIKEKESTGAKEKGIEFIELPVAFDGLTLVVNPKNDWVDHLTVAELKRIWEPQSQVKKWSDVRPGWPDREVRLYGAGTDSGTFDYFTEAIVGKSGESRADYTASEDDNVLVQGIAGDRDALGYFGFAYYVENKERLKAVPIDGGKGAITPSVQTINDGSYSPLSRPLFLYVSHKSISRPEVQAFVKFYLENAGTLADEVGYVALPEEAYKLIRLRFEQKRTGTVFAKPENAGKNLLSVLQAESKTMNASSGK
jgi:phosphate transport system substrate-binding protein